MWRQTYGEWLKNEGFQRYGLARIQRPLSIEMYDTWIQHGSHGDMDYLVRHRKLSLEHLRALWDTAADKHETDVLAIYDRIRAVLAEANKLQCQAAVAVETIPADAVDTLLFPAPDGDDVEVNVFPAAPSESLTDDVTESAAEATASAPVF